MSADTQSTFLARLREMGEKADLDVRVDNAYANVGTVSYSYAGQFEAIFTVRFDFQSTWRTVSLTFDAPGTPAAEKKFYVPYGSRELDEAAEWIWNAIKPEDA